MKFFIVLSEPDIPCPNSTEYGVGFHFKEANLDSEIDGKQFFYTELKYVYRLIKKQPNLTHFIEVQRPGPEEYRRGIRELRLGLGTKFRYFDDVSYGSDDVPVFSSNAIIAGPKIRIGDVGFYDGIGDLSGEEMGKLERGVLRWGAVNGELKLFQKLWLRGGVRSHGKKGKLVIELLRKAAENCRAGIVDFLQEHIEAGLINNDMIMETVSVLVDRTTLKDSTNDEMDVEGVIYAVYIIYNHKDRLIKN